MKKSVIYLFTVIAITFASCKGADKTGGAQADSGQTNVGNSGAADNTATSGTPPQTGTSGTDTSGNGKGTTNPTADTLKSNP